MASRAKGLIRSADESEISPAKLTAFKAYADQLIAWRALKNWSQEELGEKIGYKAPTVSAVENLRQVPTTKFAEACDKAFGTPDTFVTFRELVNREAFPAHFGEVVPYEKAMLELHGWEVGAIPGLLQTEAYARALIRSYSMRTTAEEVDRLVDLRLERQVALERTPPPAVRYILDERILRQQVGSTEVMRDQLDRILQAMDKPNIVIQVLPFTADNHAGSEGPVTVFGLPGANTVCYTACNGGGRVVDDPDEVAILVEVMHLIQASALPVGMSRELIRKTRSDLDD